MRASTGSPSSRALSTRISRTAAAPSFSDEAFPAVTLPSALPRWQRFAAEFLCFGIKEARACLFAGLFFLAVFLLPRGGIAGIARYDWLLLFALAVQAWMVWTQLET